MITYPDLIAAPFDLEADLALAQQVQTNFLPRQAPSIEGIEAYADSTFAHQVGGDFYDFMTGPAGSLFFAVGDVSYKGMSAALMMAVLRKVVQTATKVLDGPTPHAILDYANANMYDDLSINGMLATVFIGQYQPADKQLTFGNAGHAPVLYRRNHKRTCLLEAGHVPLGVLVHEQYDDTRIPMAKDDLLIVLTDGYLASKNQADMVGSCNALLSLVDCIAHESPKNIARILYEESSRLDLGMSSHDDRALLIIKGV